MGQAVLVLIEINQLLPHLIIPLAVFVVPMKSKTKRLYFETDQKSLSSLTKDDDDEVDSRDDYIKGKVSSTISERSDSPRRRWPISINLQNYKDWYF